MGEAVIVADGTPVAVAMAVGDAVEVAVGAGPAGVAGTGVRVTGEVGAVASGVPERLAFMPVARHSNATEPFPPGAVAVSSVRSPDQGCSGSDARMRSDASSPGRSRSATGIGTGVVVGVPGLVIPRGTRGPR